MSSQHSLRPIISSKIMRH